jgi:hypothetical protein
MWDDIILEKYRSRQTIHITTDTEDDWFLYVKWVENKKDIVSHTSMIIRKDLPGWITYLGSMGWKQKGA